MPEKFHQASMAPPVVSWLRPSLAALLLVAAAGCSDDFLPVSYLDGLRVLAMVADPVEAGPNDSVTVKPAIVLGKDETLTSQSLRYCPVSLGASGAYRCVVPGCETEVVADASGGVTVNPGQALAACLAKVGSSSNLEIPSSIPSLESVKSLDTQLVMKLASSSGRERTAALRIKLWASPPAVQNRNPTIQRVELDGQTVKSGTTPPIKTVKPDEEVRMRVVVDPSSLDLYTDAAGRERTEEVATQVFATAGRFQYDGESGADSTSVWKAESLEDGQTEARLYVVVRDLRGGQAVAGPFTLSIAR